MTSAIYSAAPEIPGGAAVVPLQDAARASDAPEEPPPTANAPTPAPTRSIKVEDLLSHPSSDVLPPATSPASLPQSSYEDVRKIYLHEYGKGMDLFLETDWYTTYGWDHLVQDVKTFEMFRAMLDAFAKTKTNDYENFHKLPQLEARVTWTLLCMPRVVRDKLHLVHPAAADSLYLKLNPVLERLGTFEYLITHHTPNSDSVYSPSVRQVGEHPQFWELLAQFAQLLESDSEQAWRHLSRLRQFTNQQENRDVLYSMAVVRLSLRPNDHPHTMHSNENLVARKFIEDEASSKGTNQVVQRLCGIAVRSWIALR